MTKMINTKINGEFEIILPEHRALRPEWSTSEGWEKARIHSMHEHLTKDDTMIYVGAEEGDIAGLCAMWVKDILLFEPNPRVWTNFKAIWEANNLPSPSWFSGFAANETTPGAKLTDGFAGVTGEMISDHGFSELHVSTDLPKMKIDDIDFGDRPPTALTLDVEGSEFEVLKGAEQTLRKYHPKIWLSLHPEFLFNYWGVYSNDLRNWIKGFGYKETLLAYDHEVHLFYEKS